MGLEYLHLKTRNHKVIKFYEDNSVIFLGKLTRDVRFIIELTKYPGL